MQRICFLLRLRRDKVDEYREHHTTVWPEMLRALRDAGWHNYSLFLDGSSGLLVGYLETEDFAAAQAAMERTEVNGRWQATTAPYFEALDGARPDERMRPLPLVFNLEDQLAALD
ncbi:L-rhamnose mutarotase [Cellulomonas sp. APG4]|uniref:L-rhamnose mutarotase n=1 Tax=Cellulomonas sp. APG4 TaxID=1538656 RepID=UPI00137B51FB|nr:L-rhamnose mutarotase [Cellulomonas sp. APG4]